MRSIQQTYDPAYVPAAGKQLSLSKFFAWCQSQEKYRFGWLAAMLAVHGCVLAPITIFSIFLGGNSMVFWALTIGAMAMALISNLAAMPTKITIPVFFLSILIDLTVIVINIIYFINA